MHSYQKNEELIITIDDLGKDGEGIGHAEGYALFVKDTLVGDKVRVKIIKTKKNYGYAKLLELIEASPDRVEPKCPIAKQCGGCQLQHCSYEKQLEFKENKIINCLERIGGFTNVRELIEPIIGMEEPYYYRNKAQFPVGYDKNGSLVMGFYAGRTHSIIDNTHCCIQAEINTVILEKVKKFILENHIEAYNEMTHTGLIRHVMTRIGIKTGEIMVCLVINGRILPKKEKLVKELCQIEGMTSICININQEKTNVILGKEVEVLWGTGYITDYIGSIKYQISPLSFYQVNPKQTVRLYETALDYAKLKGNEIVWDMYCGIGTISLFLAQKAKYVYGVEIIPQAIEDAKRNAKLNQIENVEFFVGAAEDIVTKQYKENMEKMRTNVVVVDPPRKGCDEKLLNTLLEMKPDRIVYVSCDPATLARDLKYLCENGYELKKARGCDMFGMSGHVECVVLMSRKDK